eukprot:31447-Prymnesium_polylepis.1
MAPARALLRPCAAFLQLLDLCPSQTHARLDSSLLCCAAVSCAPTLLAVPPGRPVPHSSRRPPARHRRAAK